MRIFSGLYFRLLIVFLFFSCQKEASVPDSNSGIQYFYDSGTEEIHGSKGLKNGSIAYVGASLGDAYILVADASGKELWRKRVGGDALDKFFSVCELTDGSIVAVGFTHSASYGVVASPPDGFAVKFSASGTVIWEKAYGTEDQERFLDCIEDKDGNLVFVGFIVAFNARSYIVKTDESGNLMWYRASQIGNYHSYSVGITLSPSGNYIIGGLNSASASNNLTRNYQTHLLSLTSGSGQPLFARIYADYIREDGFDRLFTMKMTILSEPDGYLIGSFYESQGFKGEVQLLQTDLTGSEIKQKKLPENGNLRFTSMLRGADNGVLICGAYTEESMSFDGFSSSRAALLKLDTDWNIQWISQVGANDLLQCSYTVVEREQGYRIGAISENRQKGTGKLMFYSLDKTGKLIQTHD